MLIVSSIFPNQQLQMELRKEFPDVTFEFYEGMKAAEKSFYEAEVLITYGEDLTEKHIKQHKGLKWIMLMTAGFDKLPLKAVKEKGIMVTNVHGIHKIPMAEFTIGTMLQYVKQTKILMSNESQLVWDRNIHLEELCHKTILILGVGAIGGEIARLAKAFRMKTLGVNRSGRAVENIDELYHFNQMIHALPKADFIVSILPSTPETRYLLKKEHFNAMKQSAVFINIGRGDIVAESTLIEAMRQREIAHAYLDVFEQEPLEPNHPFWLMDNVTISPHLSSLSGRYLPRSFAIFKHNLKTYLNKKNEYINLVDLQKGY
ncbi:D-2-hydroxyacid dehydrogenase [Niallia endozanthoxylica]|uniref:D-2-hydroxyacid dehydrogenase n=1 Tax=Niallia endozanthoxylica TaxID=2036016 RepID=A0A5J5I3R0_9BACI|nr:D-2-hydroxyacid dehydrogenase [Niallia endozanthoxylica]KAA9031114.1 D-2-hydroxyacid dehydrogenase [Niallia endozanthoxylica]